MFDADEFVLESFGLVKSCVEGLFQAWRDVRLAHPSLDMWDLLEFPFEITSNDIRPCTELFEYRSYYSFLLRNEGKEEMFVLDALVAQ